MLKALCKVSLCVAIFLLGCSSATHSVRSDYTLGSTPGEGLFAFSTRFVFTCPLPALAPWIVNPVLAFEGEGPRLIAILHNPFITHDFENPPGYFYVRKNEAGDYKVTEVSFSHSLRRYETERLEAPFKIRTGKAVYLGEITVKVSECDAGAGSAKLKVTVANQWGRDRKLFEQRMPKVSPDEAVIDILRP